MASREVVMSATSSENDGLFSASSHQLRRIMEYLEKEEKEKGEEGGKKEQERKDGGEEKN